MRAYVYPRPRSTFKALSGNRLRITQFLRTAPNVRLTARTTFYLGPKNAKTAEPFARAKPRRIGKGRFKATATVKLPRAWKGAFRYGSCFRYSEGSGMGAPARSARSATGSERRARPRSRRSRAPARRSPAAP